MAFNLKVPLPGVISAAFVALLNKLIGLEDGVAKAVEAAYPGGGDIVRVAFNKYEAPISAALDAVAITAKAAIELGDAARTLHAIANPKVTDGG